MGQRKPSPGTGQQGANQKKDAAGSSGDQSQDAKVNIKNYQKAIQRPLEDYKTEKFQKDTNNERRRRQKVNKNQDLKQLAQKTASMTQ